VRCSSARWSRLVSAPEAPGLNSRRGFRATASCATSGTVGALWCGNCRPCRKSTEPAAGAGVSRLGIPGRPLRKRQLTLNQRGAHQIIKFFLHVIKVQPALDFPGLSECTQCVPWRSEWAVADKVGFEPGGRLTMSRLGPAVFHADRVLAPPQARAKPGSQAWTSRSQWCPLFRTHALVELEVQSKNRW
jgi:hypothetical protein